MCRKSTSPLFPAKNRSRFVDGQTIGQLTGEFVDGQTIGQLTGEFVDGQTIGQVTGEFVDGQTIGQVTGEFVDGQTIGQLHACLLSRYAFIFMLFLSSSVGVDVLLLSVVGI
jgi:hypothetical protein